MFIHDLFLNLTDSSCDIEQRRKSVFRPTTALQKHRLGFEAVNRYLFKIADQIGVDLGLTDDLFRARFSLINSLSLFSDVGHAAYLFFPSVKHVLELPYVPQTQIKIMCMVPSCTEEDRDALCAAAPRLGDSVHVFCIPERLSIDPVCILTGKPHSAVLRPLWFGWIVQSDDPNYTERVRLQLSYLLHEGGTLICEGQAESNGELNPAAIDVPIYTTRKDFEISIIDRRLEAEGDTRTVRFAFLTATAMKTRQVTSVNQLASLLESPTTATIPDFGGVTGRMTLLRHPMEVHIPTPDVFAGCNREMHFSGAPYFSGGFFVKSVGVLTLENIKVVGPICQIIDDNNVFVIKDEETNPTYMPLSNTYGEALLGGYFQSNGAGFVSRVADIVERRIPGDSLLVGLRHSKSHGHWMQDQFPRVQYARMMGIEDHCTYIVSSEILDYQMKYLEYAGVPMDRVVKTSEYALECERLHCGSLLSTRLQGNHPMLLSFYDELAERMQLSERRAPNRDCIYLGRRNVRNDKRRLYNEDELHEFLMNEGFVDVDTESMSIEEVAASVHNAKYIIGLFGSALANLLFASPGCNVLMIQPGRMVQWSECYNMLLRPGQRGSVFFADSFDTPRKTGLNSHNILDMPAFIQAYRRWRA